MREALERMMVVIRKEFLQILRDPRMRGVIFAAPVLQLVVFGYAVSTDVRATRLWVVDHDRTAESRAVVEALTAGDWFRLAGTSADTRDIARALDGGSAVAGLEIPPGFSRDLRAGEASVQLLIDGSNSNVATVARGYAERILTEHALGTVDAAVRPPVDLRQRAWYNEELASRNYNVPAVAGLLTFLISLLLTSLAVVREREVGTLEQLMVTPIRPWELILGKSIPFAIISLFDLALVTIIGIAWFDIPFRGSIWLLGLGSLPYLICGLGIGLLISTVSSTQQEAFMTTFLVFLPTILLAGFMFPIRSMPEVFQWITLVNPLRHYIAVVRGIFLKGAGLEALWPKIAALLVIGVTVFAVAAQRFEKRVR